MMQTGVKSTKCDMCKVIVKDGGQKVSEATMRCLECEENFCDDCSNIHRVQRLAKSHHIVKIGGESTEETAQLFFSKFCRAHPEKTLDYYCTQCRNLVCVSCFVESHSTHGCKDVNTVGKDFLPMILERVKKLSNDSSELLRKKVSIEQKKQTFLSSLKEKEELILQRSQELKTLIGNHAKYLLQELSSIKDEYVKKMGIEVEEIETVEAILQNFKEYCSVLTSRGSAGHICDCFDDIMNRVDELQKHDEALLGRLDQDIKVTFKEAVHLSKENWIGTIDVQKTGIENFVIVADISNGSKITREVLKINFHSPDDFHHLPDVPTSLTRGGAADIHNNTLYVTGIGRNLNEMWKFSIDSGWDQCANLTQGRIWHCVAFVDEVLYICGGFGVEDKNVTDSIESYCTTSNECTTVGKLVHARWYSGNSVPYKKSLYIFGGADTNGEDTSHVQVYSTENNTCSLLKHPMPNSSRMKRAVVWKDSVILIGYENCFIYNFETETWYERKQFRTDAVHFGMCLVNDRVYVIGGEKSEKGSYAKTRWTCRDDVRSVSVINIVENKPVKWTEHAILPKICFVHASGIMQA